MFSQEKYSLRVQQLCVEIDSLYDSLHHEGKEHCPMTWRSRSAHLKLPSLDDLHNPPYDLSTLDLLHIYQHVGEKSLDLRDIVGLGHGRILQLATPNEYHQEVIASIRDGLGYMAIAVTEPHCGSDISLIKSYAVEAANPEDPSQEGFLISGEKLFNARLNDATHVVLFLKHYQSHGIKSQDEEMRGNSSGHRTTDHLMPCGTSLFVVPTSHPSLTKHTISACGLQGNSFGGLSFQNVFIPKSSLVGAPGEANKLFRQHFTLWRLFQCACALGTARVALLAGANYLRKRSAFGGHLLRFTHFQQALAEHTTKLYTLSLLLERTASLVDAYTHSRTVPLTSPPSFDDIITHVSMCKGECIDWCVKTCDSVMEMFGAAGYSASCSDISQRLQDLQGLRIADGTLHIMRAQVLRGVYGEDFWDATLVTPSDVQRHQTHIKGKDMISIGSRSPSYGSHSVPIMSPSQNQKQWLDPSPNGALITTQPASPLLIDGWLDLVQRYALRFPSSIICMDDLDAFVAAEGEVGVCPVAGALNMIQLVHYLATYRFRIKDSPDASHRAPEGPANQPSPRWMPGLADMHVIQPGKYKPLNLHLLFTQLYASIPLLTMGLLSNEQLIDVIHLSLRQVAPTLEYSFTAVTHTQAYRDHQLSYPPYDASVGWDLPRSVPMAPFVDTCIDPNDCSAANQHASPFQTANRYYRDHLTPDALSAENEKWRDHSNNRNQLPSDLVLLPHTYCHRFIHEHCQPSSHHLPMANNTMHSSPITQIDGGDTHPSSHATSPCANPLPDSRDIDPHQDTTPATDSTITPEPNHVFTSTMIDTPDLRLDMLFSGYPPSNSNCSVQNTLNTHKGEGSAPPTVQLKDQTTHDNQMQVVLISYNYIQPPSYESLGRHFVTLLQHGHPVYCPAYQQYVVPIIVSDSARPNKLYRYYLIEAPHQHCQPPGSSNEVPTTSTEHTNVYLIRSLPSDDAPQRAFTRDFSRSILFPVNSLFIIRFSPLPRNHAVKSSTKLDEPN